MIPGAATSQIRRGGRKTTAATASLPAAPLAAEQAVGLKTPRMARRRAHVKVRDSHAGRWPAEREMTFYLAPHTSQSSSACRGLSAVGNASQRRPLFIGRRFLLGMILCRHKKQHHKNDPSCNDGSRLSETCRQPIIFTNYILLEKHLGLQ